MLCRSMTLKKFNPKRIIVHYSRDEMKQWEMVENYNNDEELNLLLEMLETEKDFRDH